MTTLPHLTSDRNGHDLLPAALMPLAEAPCCVTGKVSIGACGQQVQVTGRGHTADEAAANFAATIAATKLALEPPAPPTRQERLAALPAKGLACAVARNDFALAQRLGKAAALVAFDMVEPGHIAGTYVVRSESTPDSWYQIDEMEQCSCPDATYRPTRACKHRLAFSLWQRLEAGPSAGVM